MQRSKNIFFMGRSDYQNLSVLDANNETYIWIIKIIIDWNSNDGRRLETISAVLQILLSFAHTQPTHGRLSMCVVKYTCYWS